MKYLKLFSVPISFLLDINNAQMHDKIKGEIDLKIPS